MNDDLIIGARRFGSRLLLGTGKYKDLAADQVSGRSERRADHHGRDPPYQYRPDAGRAQSARRAAALEIHDVAEQRRLLYGRRCRAHACDWRANCSTATH